MSKNETRSAADRLRQMTESLVSRPPAPPIQKVVPVAPAEAVQANPMLHRKQKSVYLTLELQREMKRAVGPDGKFEGQFRNESDLAETAIRAFLGLPPAPGSAG